LFGFQGGRLDLTSGKINFRHRDLDTVTDTWMEKDPIGYAAGANPYQDDNSDPVGMIDPSGDYPDGYQGARPIGMDPGSDGRSWQQYQQELARAEELKKNENAIGFVYEVEGFDEKGNPVHYTGSTMQELEERIDKSHTCSTKGVFKDKRTRLFTRKVYATPNTKLSGQGTLGSATNEALRAAEQTVMKDSGNVPGPKNTSVVNKINAATEENRQKWIDIHKVEVGEREEFSLSRLRASVREASSCLNIAFWVEKYTIGTLGRAKENHTTYLDQLNQDFIQDDLDKVDHNELLMPWPGFLMYNPNYRSRGNPA
jgi:RHS repeat-associated protein